MRKILLTLVTLATLAFASLTFADTQGYASKQVHTTNAAAQAALVHRTNIVVVNYSDYNVRISDPVYQPVDSGSTGIIWSDTESRPVGVTIRDDRGNVIFSQVVCPRALLTVSAGPSQFITNLNDRYCYGN